ncbi:MAG: ParA family protein [Burkholderiaceae bacterium]|nr:ParA family protein [Burkholderiaceae bacterium]
MNEYQPMTERLLTWLDVERLLKKVTELWARLPKDVWSIDCFSEGMEIRLASDSVNQVDEWLSKTFCGVYQREPRAIRLRIGSTLYPIELVEEQGRVTATQSYPLWRDVAYLPDIRENDLPNDVPESHEPRLPQRFVEGPDLVSFHSFKGGVGRTTALMTYVAACLQDASKDVKKILVVDADLEAPGISFWLDDSNRPTVSFVQLLEALHYPPAGLCASLDFFADELRKTSLSFGGLQRELFVLPAALDLIEIQDMPVTPEHLARNPENHWQLSDHLHALGKRLGVDAVFIDLRAGLSELASPILFDPRIDHFFVSTVAPQSILGMKEVLCRLYANNRQLPQNWQEDARPTVILSLLTKELRDSEHYESALRKLGAAYPDYSEEDSLTPSVQWLEAEFMSTLMSIASIREALDILPQSSRLFSSAKEWATSLYAPSTQSSSQVTSTNSFNASSRQQQAKKLSKACQAAEFAEGGQESPILATEPLLNLGKHYSSNLPSILMIGAKGAGKTFIFRQVVQSRTWRTFLGKLGFDSENIVNATIFPVLWSDNIEDKPNGEIKISQGCTLESIEGNKDKLLSKTVLRNKINSQLKSRSKNWDDFWDKLITAQLGVATGGLKAVNKLLIKKSARMIFVFDGIEDAFKDAADLLSAEAIDALLRLPNRVSELQNRHLGVIVFVRADYVQTVIRQNLGQWLQRFEPFRLQWNAESFLRLAYMLSSHANVIPSGKPAESLRLDELKSELEQLWGKKLGREQSKEAHSARWVYTALCDLRGNVQARDLVRFLKIAADEESKKTVQTWTDRLLTPESMRKAIPACSTGKVEEAKAEIAPLKRWVELMNEKNIHSLKVPFSAQQAGLDATLLNALQELGVIYEDKDGKLGEERLFLPEIYRTGLDFETSAAGRPRMQALLKKNIGVIPL